MRLQTLRFAQDTQPVAPLSDRFPPLDIDFQQGIRFDRVETLFPVSEAKGVRRSDIGSLRPNIGPSRKPGSRNQGRRVGLPEPQASPSLPSRYVRRYLRFPCPYLPGARPRSLAGLLLQSAGCGDDPLPLYVHALDTFASFRFLRASSSSRRAASVISLSDTHTGHCYPGVDHASSQVRHPCSACEIDRVYTLHMRVASSSAVSLGIAEPLLNELGAGWYSIMDSFLIEAEESVAPSLPQVPTVMLWRSHDRRTVTLRCSARDWNSRWHQANLPEPPATKI
jgi:hypothetical protein